jgi:hypothetical protein
MTCDLRILKAGSSSSISTGEDLMIFRIASLSSDDSARSGATEKNLENGGSISRRRMKITALTKVLKFFRLISSSTVV